MNTSESGLLNSSIPFCRSACLVLPSCMSFSQVKDHYHLLRTHKSEILDAFTDQEILDDVERNDELGEKMSHEPLEMRDYIPT